MNTGINYVQFAQNLLAKHYVTEARLVHMQVSYVQDCKGRRII
jgi:hypothetical protein